MVLNRVVDRKSVSVAEAHFARLARQGSGAHRHLAALVAGAGADSSRDLCDAVHLLCGLHGRYPGLVDLALQRASTARDWLESTADSFERERLYLVRLTAAVGPLPSTPGSAETESSLLTQRSALDVLAASERRGCALGAVAALVGDWQAIRPLLDRAAARAGLTVPTPTLPSRDSIEQVIESEATTTGSERAFGFGSEQMLLQHRGLFDLLEARASARSAC